MGILSRFNDIIKANINALLDKAEDPGKMIDQYMRELVENLAEVRQETAGVLAEETRTKRMLDENNEEIEKYTNLAKRALQAGNEDDARVFLSKKQELSANTASLQKLYDIAHGNADKMRQMHDKLVSDIETLKSRQATIHAKVAVAKTQEKINDLSGGSDKANSAMDAFSRMEAKADSMLDRANAMAELQSQPTDEAKALEEKYASGLGDTAVEDELAKMKQELGL